MRTKSGGSATALLHLPHQIPFRAASAIRTIDDTHIDGAFLWTANDAMPAELMLIEAMAQFAGGLAFEGQGFLSGIDRCEVTKAIEPGDLVDVSVDLEADFGGVFRFNAVARVDGVEVARGRFYLSTHAQT